MYYTESAHSVRPTSGSADAHRQKQAQLELSKAEDLYYAYEERKHSAGFMSAADASKEFRGAKHNTDSLIEKLFEGDGRIPNPLLD